MGAILIDIFIWWLILLLIGVILLPIGVRIFSSFQDKGYLFTKVLGLAVLSYLVFVLANMRLLPFHRFTILLMAAVVMIAECVWLLCSRQAALRFGETLRNRNFWVHVAIEEVVFMLTLLVWAYLRSRTPALDHTEMFMDHGFVKSILNADYLPAADMWYAGGTINYYYYGQYVTAFLCRLSGRSSGVGYNLMMATLFALTFVLSFSIAYQLLCMKQEIRRSFAVIGGILSALVVTLSGNAHAFLYAIIFPLLNRLGLMEYSFGHDIDRYWYPDATRYIHCFEGSTDGTITEFPLYSFVLSDLHAHVVDIVFVLLFLALLIQFISTTGEQKQKLTEWLKSMAPMLLLLGLLLGIMAMTNYWDFAIYMVVFVFFAMYQAWKRYRSWKQPALYMDAALLIVCVFLLGKLVMLPFTLSFEQIHVGLAFAKDHSPINEYLVLWGIPLAWVILFGSYVYHRWKQGELKPADIIVGIYSICAVGLIAAPEVLYIEDIYSNAPRCNTMFKFTYEAFILFGLITGYIMVNTLCKCKNVLGNILLIVLLLLPPFCYPYYAIHEVYFTGENAKALDGLAYIAKKDAKEYTAIEWIDENVAKDAVILEVNALSYTEGDRLSMATGRPTVQGWWTHEMLWRNLSSDDLNVRIADIREIYEGMELMKTEELIEQYGIDYIYIGTRECEAFPELQSDKLKELSDMIYDFDGTLLLHMR